MSTSVIRNEWGTKALKQLALAAFFAVFGTVYEMFSHGVYSVFMQYAFLIPLVLGAVPYAIEALRAKRQVPSRAVTFWNLGILTLTLGSAFMGVLEIYGTTNRLTVIYPIAGIAMLAAGLLSLIRSDRRSR